MAPRHCLAACLVALAPTLAFACEPPAIFYTAYEPRSGDAEAGDIAAFVARTKPVIRNTSLARGAPGEPSMCGGMGYINVEIALPPGAPYTLGQVGTEITLAEGRFHDHVFPKGPVMPSEAGADTLDLGNAWYEGPPPQHKPIDAAFDLRLVAPDGTRGPAARVVVRSAPKRSGKAEGVSR